jgi:hypothetical protein
VAASEGGGGTVMAFPLERIQVFQFPALGAAWPKAAGRIRSVMTAIREFLYMVYFLF